MPQQSLSVYHNNDTIFMRKIAIITIWGNKLIQLQARQ